MGNYVITVNSTVDLPKEWLEERNIPVMALRYTIDGETYEDMSGLSHKEFFQKLREGKMAVTTQMNPEEAKEKFEPILKAGNDILHLGFSSGLSGTYNSMRIAAEELAEEYMVNVQKSTYLLLKQQLKDRQDMELESEAVLEDQSILLTINVS